MAQLETKLSFAHTDKRTPDRGGIVVGRRRRGGSLPRKHMLTAVVYSIVFRFCIKCQTSVVFFADTAQPLPPGKENTGRGDARGGPYNKRAPR